MIGKKDLTLDNCIEKCQSAEKTTAETERVAEKRSNIESASLYAADYKKGAGREPKDLRQTQRSQMQGTRFPNRYCDAKMCKFCGLMHDRRLCPAYGKSCAKCGRPNHFAAVCRRSGNATVRWMMEEDEHENLASLQQQESDPDGRESWQFMPVTQQENNEAVLANSSEVNMACAQSMRSGQKKIFADLEINGHRRRFQIDTGATCNVVGLHDLPPHTDLKPTRKTLSLYDTTTIRPEGVFNAKVSNPFTTKECEAEFLVVKSERAIPILGAPTSLAMNLVVIPHQQMLEAEEIQQIGHTMTIPRTKEEVIRKFQVLFEDGLGAFPGSAHLEIDEEVPPVKLPLRKVPLAVKEDLENELKRLEHLGVIVREERPTEWVSSLVVARKANGKIRVCIDPKPLNKALKRTLYPLPVLDNILPRLRKARIFSICDISSGYWHVSLDEQSSQLTTFATPFGRFRWQRLPFGISVAPEIFQTQLDAAINGLKGVATIVDDMIVWGEGDDDKEAELDHDRNLMKLMERCLEMGIKLSPEKFRHKQPAVNYVGHILSARGLESDPRKVAAIMNMDIPKSRADLQRFLGMVTYLGKFMSGLSELCAPLRALLQEKTEWLWTREADEAVKGIKKAVSSTPVLKYFDETKRVTIQCDASSTGLGAVLLQGGQPVTYASRTLSAAEQNYAQIEKELLAVLFALEKFDQYVYGRHVDVDSDHKPLQIITAKPILTAPKRLQRMLLRLQRYEYTVHFRPGKEMYIADALSRATGQTQSVDSQDTDLEDVAVLQTSFEQELEKVHSAQDLILTDSKIERLRKSTHEDVTLQIVAQLIKNGWPETVKDVDPAARAYFHVRDELTMDNDIVFRSNRCVIPADLRKDVMKKIHEGHIGMEGSLRRAREHVFWPGMTSHVKDYISKCGTCQSMGQRQPKETLTQTEFAPRPWSTVGADLFQFGGLHYLAVVDYHSNFFEVEKLPDTVQHSDSVTEKTLCEVWYSAGVKNRQWPAICSQWISKV